jgi:hypothetical protein
VVGASDAKGEGPAGDGFSPDDLAATFYHGLGLDPKQGFRTPSGRPIALVRNEQPIEKLFLKNTIMKNLIPHVSGGGPGFFNHRFASPTRFNGHHAEHTYPCDVFPFTYGNRLRDLVHLVSQSKISLSK